MKPVIALSVLSSLCACVERDVSRIDPNQSREQIDPIAIELVRDLDILFVIDDSGSMGEEQASLARNFPRFTGVFESLPGPLPNLHIGIVSTNMGAGPYAIDGCGDGGDGGALQHTPGDPQCAGPAGAFIRDVANPDGTRQRNYTGSLADTFACIAQLGIHGCGFEQPFESMRRALDGSQVTNDGFLRDGALLAIVFITDEDDCSTADPGLFDTSQTSVDDPLGPLSSFRCFEHGVDCGDGDPRQPGPRLDCAPRADSAYMVDVADYVEFLTSLKPNPQDVMVAGIIGPASPVAVGVDNTGTPIVESSCVTSAGSATPAVRIQALLDAFPDSVSVSICNEELSAALEQIARQFAAPLVPCLTGELADADPDTSGVQPTCVLSEIRDYGTATERESTLPVCDVPDAPDESTALPCYQITEDPQTCAAFPSRLAVSLHYGGASVPPRTRVVAHCVAE